MDVTCTFGIVRGLNEMTRAISGYFLQKDYLFSKFWCIEFLPVFIFLSTLQLNFWFHESCISKGPKSRVQSCAKGSPPPVLLWTQDLSAPANAPRLSHMRLHLKSQFLRRGYFSSKKPSNNNKKSYRACLLGPAKAFVRN